MTRTSAKSRRDAESQLIEQVARFTLDPLGFVLFAFPWREAGTELADHGGPRMWQRDILKRVGVLLRRGWSARAAIAESMAMDPVQVAVASGHGIGKSALLSWLNYWAMSTCTDCRGVVTANTESQLQTKTWPELGKWHRLAINKHWFTFSATSLFSSRKEHVKTWRLDAIPWNDTKPEAFAGLHNQGKRVIVTYDEASAIPDKIWEVSEGALTDDDTEILWFAFGNPTQNTGRFRQCFGKYKHRWETRQIDSRNVEGTNKGQLNKWVEDYGEDHDFVRVRVRGMFPRSGSMQLIPGDVIQEAMRREAQSTINDPLIMMVDVARFGDDQSVIGWRRGLDARSEDWEKHRGMDTMQLAGRVAALIVERRPDAVFIDETGIGAGVIDRLRQLGHQVQGVNFGSKADSSVDGVMGANKRAEMWLRGMKWLKEGGAIPDDQELLADLEGPEYGYDLHNRIQLEKKSDMKKRGLASPDCGDALMLSFAFPVAQVDVSRSVPGADKLLASAMYAGGGGAMEYDPYARDRLCYGFDNAFSLS